MENGKRVMESPRKAKRRSSAATRSVPKFYTIYLICVVVTLAAIFIACFVIHSLLGEYETAQPKYVAQEVFDDYFTAPLDLERLVDEAEYDAGMASRASVLEYLQSEVGGEQEMTWSVGSSTEKNEVKYVVKAGRKQLGAIVLTATGRTAHGFKTYEPARVELSLDPASIPGGVATIQAPVGFTVMVDGAPLDVEPTSTFLNPDALKYHPSDYTGIEYAVYPLTGLDSMPSNITVTDSQGNGSMVTFDEKTSTYLASPIFSQELADQYGDFVLEGVERYAAYMQRAPGSSFNNLKGYFDPNSDLYDAISAAGGNLWMVYAPSRNEFQDIVVDQFYPFSDDMFSCHVAFTQMLYRNGEGHPDNVDMYVFLHKTAGGYKIYEWYNNTV